MNYYVHDIQVVDLNFKFMLLFREELFGHGLRHSYKDTYGKGGLEVVEREVMNKGCIYSTMVDRTI